MDRRRSGRRSLQLLASASAPGADETEVLIRDISPGGLLLDTEPGALLLNDRVHIELPEWGVADARVAWKSGRLIGCEFAKPIAAAAISAALLKSQPPATGERESASPSVRIGRELNFSAAFLISLALWVVIGFVVYALAR